MKKEEWKQLYVNGHEVNYEVSSLGRIRNRSTGRIATTHAARGYNTVRIYLPWLARNRTMRVAPLVVAAFIRPRRPGEQIDHLNGISTDDRVANLTIVPDQSINVRRAIALHGPSSRRINHRFSKRSYDLIDRLWSMGTYSQMEIAKMLGVNNSAISRVVNRVQDPEVWGKTELTIDWSVVPKFKRGIYFGAKLTPEQVREIYTSELPARTLAEQYGVSRAAIWSIKSGRTWRDVTGAVA